MKDDKQVLDEIATLTSTIENKYPEVYRFLDENPITIPSSAYPDLTGKTLEGYLQDLKDLVRHHLQTHKNEPV